MEVSRAGAGYGIACAVVLEGRTVVQTGRREGSSAAGAHEPVATTPRAAESWGESLAMLPARSLFVAVALVQIGAELAVGALRKLANRDGIV